MLTSPSRHRNNPLLIFVSLGSLVLLLDQTLLLEGMGQSPIAERQGGNAEKVAKPNSSNQETLSGSMVS